jgi:hypothetical protein
MDECENCVELLITCMHMCCHSCHTCPIIRLLGGFAEIPIFVQRLPIFYKQRNYNF